MPDTMNNKIRTLGKSIIFLLYYVKMELWLPILFRIHHKNGNLKYLDETGYNIWKNAFLSLLKEHCRSCYGFKQRELLTAFPTAKITKIKSNPVCDKDNPIIVLSVKNDRKRIEMLIRHYRKLGTELFAIIDNGSDDGTFEWLLEQKDVDLYRTDDSYTSLRKEAWINRIVSYYGLNRWYILTDSDELVTYTGMEEHTLRDVVQYATHNSFKRLEALTLDMYSKDNLFSRKNVEDIQKEYCWMDKNSYTDKPKQVGCTTVRWLTGGPRMRKMGVSTSLLKFPLVYFEPGTISANAHFVYPYQLMNNAPCNLAILHYKFLENDLAEYQKRASSSSGFAFKGGYYRKYMDFAISSQSFYDENSIQFKDSNSLLEISFIQPIDFGAGTK